MSRFSIALLVVLAGLAPAMDVRADLHPLVVPGPGSSSDSTFLIATEVSTAPVVTLERRSYLDENTAGAFIEDVLASGGLEGLWAPLGLPGEGVVSTSSNAEVRELPPLPGSAALFLSAMLSMGAWQLIRSTRHLHLGQLPDWYHAGGPAQVGHAVPFDLDFGAAPLCCFEQPTGARPIFYRIKHELPARFVAQSFLRVAAPRGPPTSS